MLSTPFIEDFARRLANLSPGILLRAGVMSGIVSVILLLASGHVGIDFTAYNIPLVYALWVIDDMGYKLREHPGVYVAVGLVGGLLGTVMNSLFA